MLQAWNSSTRAVLLCKGLKADLPFVQFYTSYLLFTQVIYYYYNLSFFSVITEPNQNKQNPNNSWVLLEIK